VFQSPEKSLFTRQSDLKITIEPHGNTAAAVVLAPAHAGNRLTLRYLRLGTKFDPPPPGKCPAGMVRLPGGTLGGEHGGRVAPFCMDATEVTVRAYSACVRAGHCPPAPTTVQFDGITDELRAKWNPKCHGARQDRLDHPINCIEWAQASTYCRAQGKRLPTEEEWEWAAQGGDQERTYPWGYRAPDAQLCWSGRERRDSTCPVGSFPEGDARGGIHDLAGNVGEWTSSTEPDGHVVKAGGWNMPDPASARSASREVAIPAFRGPTTGFRCVE
jgi:formylglycine-generating enzyme required for sulfatase activity